MSTILSGFGKRVGFTTLFKRPSYELKVSVTGPAKRYHQRNAARNTFRNVIGNARRAISLKTRQCSLFVAIAVPIFN